MNFSLPVIAFHGALPCVSISVQTDAPCNFVCSASGLTNSVSWPIAQGSTPILIPVPVAQADVTLEITPDFTSAVSEPSPGFLSVNRHVLLFKFVSTDGAPVYQYVEHQLWQGGSVYHLDLLKICEIVALDAAKCIICHERQPAIPMASCSHPILCQECQAAYSPVFATCPVCQGAGPDLLDLNTL